MMKTYLVGGAVRDTLLGIEPKDRDYVIVGATAKDVEDLLASGFTKVGADFPVFLHPETGEEYALARVERKISAGYLGFETFTSPELTIEDDLRRRDLTINAMAIDMETGELIDPFDGQEDLKNGVIRHVSKAFAEDPLRVLRIARFVARYGFTIHPTTYRLAMEISSSEEMEAISQERLFTELMKILNEPKASNGIICLMNFGLFSLISHPSAAADCFLHVVQDSMVCKHYALEIEKFNCFDADSKFLVLHFSCDSLQKSFIEKKIPRDLQRKLKYFWKTYEAYQTFNMVIEESHKSSALVADFYLLWSITKSLSLAKGVEHLNDVETAVSFVLQNHPTTPIRTAHVGVFFKRLKNLSQQLKSLDREKIASEATLNGTSIPEAIKHAEVEVITNFFTKD